VPTRNTKKKMGEKTQMMLDFFAPGLGMLRADCRASSCASFAVHVCALPVETQMATLRAIRPPRHAINERQQGALTSRYYGTKKAWRKRKHAGSLKSCAWRVSNIKTRLSRRSLEDPQHLRVRGPPGQHVGAHKKEKELKTRPWRPLSFSFLVFCPMPIFLP
jgi:hypothetical protein